MSLLKSQNSSSSLEKRKKALEQSHADLLKYKPQSEKGGDDPDLDLAVAVEEEGEPWLISYADLMTLLFGLFAMLFTFATFEDIKKNENIREMKESISEYFGGGIYVPPTEFLAKKFKLEIQKAADLAGAKLVIGQDRLELSFVTHFLFQTGGAELTEMAHQSIQQIAQLLLMEKRQIQIVVEGHTDDIPIHTKEFHSNWDLSATRAARIVDELESAGIAPSMLSAIGLGSSRPEYPNRDDQGHEVPESQALNRRVVLRVSFPAQPKPFTQDSAVSDGSVTPSNAEGKVRE